MNLYEQIENLETEIEELDDKEKISKKEQELEGLLDEARKRAQDLRQQERDRQEMITGKIIH